DPHRRNHRRLLVHPDPRRRPLPRRGRGRPQHEPGLHAADRPGRRRPRLRRRPAADRRLLRGRLAGRLRPDPRHQAAEVPGRDPAGVDVADAGRPNDRHVRPPLGGAAPDQRRHRRRPGRAGCRRPPPRPRHPLRPDRRVPLRMAAGAGRRDGHPPRRAPDHRRRPDADPRRPEAPPAALLRRLLAGGPGRRRPPRRPLPDLGRAAGPRRRKDRQRPRPRRGGGAADALRPPPPRDRPRDGGRGLGGRRAADLPARRGDRRPRPGRLRPDGLPWPGADAAPSRRQPRATGDQPEPVGRRRPGPRRRRHRPRRRPGDGRGPDAGVHGPRDRHVHPQRLPPPGGGLPLRRADVPPPRRRPGRGRRGHRRLLDRLRHRPRRVRRAPGAAVGGRPGGGL
ncbi:MAG: Alkanesulfonate monooxygenase, partial [uncultured Thermomicrobiales bacterium]